MTEFQFKNVSKTFDGIHALVNVDLNLPLRDIVAIVGPNGAGKTTLLNVITGFLQPDSGRCFLGAREITGMAPHQIAALGIVRTFQDLRFIHHVSVLENVMLARPNQRGEKLIWALLRWGVAEEERWNRQEALRWLQFVGLEENANELAGDLSYGQQKLLTLACCLATEAHILLLDEPVAGVHPELIEKILGLMQELREQGKLIVFIEHDIAAVREVADRVIVMDEGRIIADGPPADVLDTLEIIEAYVT